MLYLKYIVKNDCDSLTFYFEHNFFYTQCNIYFEMNIRKCFI